MSWVMEAIRAEAVSSRMNRRMYWVVVLVLLAAETIIQPQPTIRNGLIIIGFWLFAYVFRLHDTGRSAWWAASTMAAIIVLMGLAFLLTPNALAEMYGHSRGAPEQNAGLGLSFVALAILVFLGFTVWLGVVRGDPSTNRYGVPITGWRFLQPSPKDATNSSNIESSAPGRRDAAIVGKDAPNTGGGPNEKRPRPLLDFRQVQNPWIRLPLQVSVVAGALAIALVAWIGAWQLINATGLAPWSRPLNGWMENLKAKAGRPER